MAEAFIAYPELRYPFEKSDINPRGTRTVLYRGNSITLSETGEGDDLLIRPEDLSKVNGFELKPEGACYGDLCIPVKDDMTLEQGGQTWSGSRV